MARKRGELPTLNELTLSLKSNTHVVVEAEHRYINTKYKKDGKKKFTYVRVMNITTGEKSKWMQLNTARKQFGTQNKQLISVNKHTDATIAKKVKELTNDGAKLISWEHSKRYGAHIEIKIQYVKCGCYFNTYLLNNVTPTECPIHSAKWKTENEVCNLIEETVPKLEDKDIRIETNRQKTVHMKLKNGEEFNRRFDMVVEITHRDDKTCKRWVAVEYNGEQHYRPVNFGNLTEEELMEAFKGNKIRDAQKAAYCKRWNIPLIVIPYWEKHNIEEIVKTKVKDAIWEEAFTVLHLFWQKQCLTS